MHNYVNEHYCTDNWKGAGYAFLCTREFKPFSRILRVNDINKLLDDKR